MKRHRTGLWRVVRGAAAALVLAAAAHAQDDGRPLPPGDVTVSPRPPARVERSQRMSRQAYIVLAIGGGIAAAFVVLAISGFFKQPGT